ncbi:hypothetical protein [Nitrosovibrio sp. Nv4]|uniref:hypothetical protein n=1 Tax=Nitrosovibrio sp. Nv4 TaxID=1945880 RepID=UPI000BDC8334|nr:hypothetical protein [Nitrosovibrio sp. Nv4]SOD42425.1 hypothetical protein SAMN06298226_2764 [Nitrosovibrio sp. Nv4]
MSEPIQIARAQRPGEPIPHYSTMALLCGCTFPAPTPAKNEVPEWGRIIGSRKGAAVLKQRRDERFEPHLRTIIKMLKDGESAAAIGRAIGMSETPIRNYIRVKNLREVESER